MPTKPKRGKAQLERRVTFALFTIPGLILYTALYIFPIFYGAYYSFTDWNGITRSYNFVGLDNYKSLLSDRRFRSAFTFNIKFSVLLIVFTLVIGLALALLLNQKIRGRTVYRALYFVPAVLSGVTVGLIFNQIFYRVVPPIGQSLDIKVISSNILANPKLAMWGVLFVTLWQGLAIPTIMLLAGLQTVPEELYESAKLDGAGGWQRLTRITLPFLLPIISVILVFTLKNGLMLFDSLMSLTNGGPAGATESIALLIYQHGFAEHKYGYSIAEAITAGLVICAISAIQIAITNRKKVA